MDAATEYEEIMDAPIVEEIEEGSSMEALPHTEPESASSAVHVVPVQAIVPEGEGEASGEDSFQWGDLGLDE